MADDIELPDPDGYVGDQSRPGAPLRPAYLARTVRRLIAEHVAAAVAAESKRCAALCRAAQPAGGRAWDTEQAACFEALEHVAQAILGTLPGAAARGGRAWPLT